MFIINENDFYFQIRLVGQQHHLECLERELHEHRTHLCRLDGIELSIHIHNHYRYALNIHGVLFAMMCILFVWLNHFASTKVMWLV